MKIIAIFISLLIIFMNLKATDGSLDPSFGAGKGFVDTALNSFFAFVPVIQANGKIVVLGINMAGMSIIIRYNTNGTIDTTFGTNGIVTDNTGISASDVILQPDGKIIIGGVDALFENFQLIRYNSNGTIDASFGINGVVTGPSGVGNSMALQIDGKIILVGTNNNTGLFEVVRYNPNGSIDIVFESGPDQFALDVAIQDDGKIIVAGNSSVFDLTLVRYNTDGSLDGSFVAGAAPPGIWGPLVLQPDGKVIVIGNTNAVAPVLELARFNTDGSLDTSFGGGVITGPPGVANGLVLQADGKAIIVGQPSFDGPTFQLVRYTTNGLLDATFGSDGIVQTPPGIAAFDGALQIDGKIIAVGSDLSFSLFQIARYINHPIITPTQIQTSTTTQAGVLLQGTAQNPSQIYIFKKGKLIGSTITDPAGTNTWSFVAPNPSGGYGIVAIYPDGKLSSSSDRMWLSCVS